MKLDTQNIFLDTSTFEQNNFLIGKKLNTLLNHTGDNSINVFSSEIAIKELKERVRKKIAKAKAEIINNIKEKGTIILNRDDKFFTYFRKKAKSKKIKIVTFGKDKKSDIFPLKIIRKKKFNKNFNKSKK